MKVVIFDRPGKDPVKLGEFFKKDRVVKFLPQGEKEPLSDEGFKLRWGLIYFLKGKKYSVDKPDGYLRNLKNRFIGRVWVEEVKG